MSVVAADKLGIVTRREYLAALESHQFSPFELQAMELELCRHDAMSWFRIGVTTVDESDPKDPIKRIPSASEKPYLPLLVWQYYHTRLLLVPKSRRMLVTWTFLALVLHDVAFFRGRGAFLASKKEADACDLLHKVRGLWDRQPEHLKWTRIEPRRMKPGTAMLYWPEIDSWIRAIPQGSDQVRQYTASIVFSDEMAHQDEAEQAFVAAQPLIEHGCKFVGVSSAAPGFFQALMEDEA